MLVPGHPPTLYLRSSKDVTGGRSRAMRNADRKVSRGNRIRTVQPWTEAWRLLRMAPFVLLILTECSRWAWMTWCGRSVVTGRILHPPTMVAFHPWAGLIIPVLRLDEIGTLLKVAVLWDETVAILTNSGIDAAIHEREVEPIRLARRR